jgi:hypothetical protein
MSSINAPFASQQTPRRFSGGDSLNRRTEEAFMVHLAKLEMLEFVMRTDAGEDGRASTPLRSDRDQAVGTRQLSRIKNPGRC